MAQTFTAGFGGANAADGSIEMQEGFDPMNDNAESHHDPYGSEDDVPMNDGGATRA